MKTLPGQISIFLFFSFHFFFFFIFGSPFLVEDADAASFVTRGSFSASSVGRCLVRGQGYGYMGWVSGQGLQGEPRPDSSSRLHLLGLLEPVGGGGEHAGRNQEQERREKGETGDKNKSVGRGMERRK